MEGALKPTDEEEYSAFLEDLKRQLRLRGTLQDASLALGFGPRYLYDVLNGEKEGHPLTAKLYLRLVKMYGLSFPSSIPTLQQRGFDKPVEILRDHRESSKPPFSAFLGQIRRRIGVLLHGEVSAEVPGISVARLLAAIEEQRYGDRLSAQEAAQKLVFGALKRLERGEGPKPAKEVGELAATLALWATIQRMRGFRDLAIEAFAFAFPLARHANDSWALGCCYQRAGFLLRDFDRPDLGYGFVTEAIGHFSASRSQLEAWKCRVDRGNMLNSNGNVLESISEYQSSLLLLPGSEWRSRVGALQGLGVNYQLQGKPEQARVSLAGALAECRKIDLYAGHIKWLSAKVEASLGQSERALNLFHEATELLARYGSAGDVALVCVDHAELLLSLKKYRELVQMVVGVGRWLPQLNANPMLCRAFDTFVDLARAARLELAELENTRKAVTDAAKLGDRTIRG